MAIDDSVLGIYVAISAADSRHRGRLKYAPGLDRSHALTNRITTIS